MAWTSHEFEVDEATIGTTEASVLTRQLKRVHTDGRIALSNTGSYDLNSYIVQVKAHQSDDWTDLISNTDFNSTSSRLLAVSTNRPHTLAAGDSAWFDMNMKNIHDWRHRATTGTGETTVQVRGVLGSNS